MGTSSFFDYDKMLRRIPRPQTRKKIEVVNRGDRRVAIYLLSRSLCRSRQGQQGTKRSAAFSKKRQSLFFEITSSRLRAGP